MAVCDPSQWRVYSDGLCGLSLDHTPLTPLSIGAPVSRGDKGCICKVVWVRITIKEPVLILALKSPALVLICANGQKSSCRENISKQTSRVGLRIPPTAAHLDSHPGTCGEVWFQSMRPSPHWRFSRVQPRKGALPLRFPAVTIRIQEVIFCYMKLGSYQLATSTQPRLSALLQLLLNPPYTWPHTPGIGVSTRCEHRFRRH